LIVIGKGYIDISANETGEFIETEDGAALAFQVGDNVLKSGEFIERNPANETIIIQKSAENIILDTLREE
jgi:hypothetical protein